MSKALIRLLAILITFALTMPVFAKANKTKALSLSLPIVDTVKLGGIQLNPGDYTVVVDGDKLTVEKGKQVVANVTGHWEDQKTKAQATEYLSNNGQVTELFFSGEARAFVPGE